MKLMLCLTCGDVVKLHPQPRTCLCGASSGQYLADDATVEQSEGTVSIALHNHDLRAALDAYFEAPQGWHPLMVLRAYINPLSEPDVRYRGNGDPNAPSAPAPAAKADEPG